MRGEPKVTQDQSLMLRLRIRLFAYRNFFNVFPLVKKGLVREEVYPSHLSINTHDNGNP